jgi:hypothetical protein
MIPLDRAEIETWGKLFDAKWKFLKVLAKLIRETTPKSTFLQMPSGSAMNRLADGYDKESMDEMTKPDRYYV